MIELIAEAQQLANAGDFGAALSSVDDALVRLEAMEIDPARREVVRYQLLFSRGTFQFSDLEYSGERYLPHHMHFIGLLRQPAETALGEAERESMLLRSLTIAEGLGGEAVSESEFFEMYGQVPHDARTIRFWHDISVWAFCNAYRQPLSMALEFALQNPTDKYTEAIWQRINLMHRSVSGELQEHEILHYLSLLTLLGQLVEFINVFQPRLEDRGSWTPAIERRLAEVRTRIEQASDRQTG